MPVEKVDTYLGTILMNSTNKPRIVSTSLCLSMLDLRLYLSSTLYYLNPHIFVLKSTFSN